MALIYDTCHTPNDFSISISQSEFCSAELKYWNFIPAEGSQIT